MTGTMTKAPQTEMVSDERPNSLKSIAAESAISRAAQEVQAAMAIAKRCPRDEKASYARLMSACKRKGLAECAIYEYPKGGTKVEGPSIRLAEAAAQAWGNINFGVTELEQRIGESVVEAFCWDLETNTKSSKTFTIRHELHTKNGNRLLSDPRDIYEMVANQGARRLRACILAVIPGDVIDDAIAECERTLSSGTKESLGDRVRKMLVAFTEFGVTQAMIEQSIGHGIDSISESELVKLRKKFVSIKDGMGGIHDFFQPVEPAEGQPKTKKSRAQQLEGRLGGDTAPTEPVSGDPPQEAEKPAEGPVDVFGEWKLVVDGCSDMKSLNQAYMRFAPQKPKMLPAIGQQIEEYFAERGRHFG